MFGTYRIFNRQRMILSRRCGTRCGASIVVALHSFIKRVRVAHFMPQAYECRPLITTIHILTASCTIWIVLNLGAYTTPAIF